MQSSIPALVWLTGLLAVTVTAVPQDYSTSSPRAKVAYFLSNDADQNVIHALRVREDGTLDNGRLIPTGGKGSRAPATMITDALDSQGPLQRIGNRLLAVNAGSNTLSMLAIDEKDPFKLTLVGAPVDTLGDFPVSIAVSEKVKDIVCVANSGTRSGVACFKMSVHGLIPTDKTQRPLPLDPIQSNPPVGPFNTVSQILFNAEGTALWATVKGNPNDKTRNSTGYFGSFAIQNGVVSDHLVRTSPPGTASLFGSVPLAGNKIFATDATFGVTLLQVSSSGEASEVKKYTIPNNRATCWATISPATGLAYVTDGGVNQVVAFDPLTVTPKASTPLENDNPAMFEIVPYGDLLYALSHGNSSVPPAVIVMQPEGASGKIKAIQNFHPQDTDSNISGLVLY